MITCLPSLNQFRRIWWDINVKPTVNIELLYEPLSPFHPRLSFRYWFCLCNVAPFSSSTSVSNNFECTRMQHAYLDISNCTPLAQTFWPLFGRLRPWTARVDPSYWRLFISNNYITSWLFWYLTDILLFLVKKKKSHTITKVVVFLYCVGGNGLWPCVFLTQCNRKSHNWDLSFLTCHSLCGIIGSITPKLSAV